MLHILSMTKSAGYPTQTLDQIPRYHPQIAKNPIHAVAQTVADISYLHPGKVALVAGIPLGIMLKQYWDKKQREKEVYGYR